MMNKAEIIQTCEQLARECELLARHAERISLPMGQAIYNAGANLEDAVVMARHAKER